MKKMIMVLMLVLSSVSMALAASSNGVGSIDKECKARGFDYGIAKFEYIGKDRQGQYVLEEMRQGYNITVNGTNSWSTQWSSNARVNGVVTKEGKLFYNHPGGLSGIVEKGDKYGISHVTFCGRETSGGGGGDPHGVPEFSPMTMAVAIVLAGLGIAAMRRN